MENFAVLKECCHLKYVRKDPLSQTSLHIVMDITFQGNHKVTVYTEIIQFSRELRNIGEGQKWADKLIVSRMFRWFSTLLVNTWNKTRILEVLLWWRKTFKISYIEFSKCMFKERCVRESNLNRRKNTDTQLLPC